MKAVLTGIIGALVGFIAGEGVLLALISKDDEARKSVEDWAEFVFK